MDGAERQGDDCVKTVGVQRVLNHPNYNPRTTNNDISLIFLDAPLPYSPIAASDPVDGVAESPGEKVMVAGWGRTSSGGPVSDAPQDVEVEIIAQDECNQKYDGEITDTMVCAGREGGGYDSCQGDSGGPLFAVDDDEYTLVGVVSWGIGCALPNYPGVYARVSVFEEWICREAASQQPDMCGPRSPATPPQPSPPAPSPPPPTPTPIDVADLVGFFQSSWDEHVWEYVEDSSARPPPSFGAPSPTIGGLTLIDRSGAFLRYNATYTQTTLRFRLSSYEEVTGNMIFAEDGKLTEVVFGQNGDVTHRRVAAPPSPPPKPPFAPPKPPSPPVEAPELCIEDCNYSSDGECDDGGPGADYNICQIGRDCVDCGPRPDPDGSPAPPALLSGLYKAFVYGREAFWQLEQNGQSVTLIDTATAPASWSPAQGVLLGAPARPHSTWQPIKPRTPIVCPSHAICISTARPAHEMPSMAVLLLPQAQPLLVARCSRAQHCAWRWARSATLMAPLAMMTPRRSPSAMELSPPK